ncbi:MAG: hypothetical protein FWH32_03255 [Clostridiales bacterium]|nr:hypothetical protein [Clostridiales bacterium]
MEWSFPSNNKGDINGISNSGVETFQGTPLKSLAREICQNSLDAASNDQPVEVEFVPFSLSIDEFPDAESLQKAFVASQDFWSTQKSKRTVDFFERAIDMMKSESIPFLRISDFSTLGLSGSREEYNTPWCNLTKSSGASDKSGTSGGSFGIGKFAPFACSEFRTVFYSTLDIESVTASQGISRITSFRHESGEITTGVGYYGAPNNQPAHSQLILDSRFRRDSGQVGTDIFISGFKFHSTDWKADVIASVLDGFLYAIHEGHLIVRVDDVIVSKDTLQSLLAEYQTSLLENADKYYTVLTSADTVWYETDFKNHGTIKLGLIIQPEMHRRVAMVRKTGMKIMDRGNISGIIPFAGVMLIEGEKINDYLRNIENPQHTKWEPERIEPKTQIPNAKAYIKDLLDYIKESLEKLKHEDDSDEIDPDVGEYLPDEGEDDSLSNNHPKESLPDTIKSFEATSPPKRTVSSSFSDNDGEKEVDDDMGDITAEENDSGIGHDNGENGGGGNGSGNSEGSGSGTNPKERKRSLSGISAAKVRVVCLNREAGEYSITFVPATSANDGYLDLFLSAESQNYEAPILSAIDLNNPAIQVNGNRISDISFVVNTPIRIKVVLNFKDYCSMEVKAYGYKI